MSKEKKLLDKAEELAEFAEIIMGDMDQTDDYEVEEMYQEFSQGKDPAESIREIASKATQKHRLAGRSVPLHVQLALDATGPKDLNSTKPYECH